MTEYINKTELINEVYKNPATNDFQRLTQVINAVRSAPVVDVVSTRILEQIRWERDVAIEQLESYGVGFAEEADVVKVKHGKWLRTDAYPHRIYCSVCHKTYVTNEEVIQGRSWEYPAYCTEAEWCPHCGAKMDERGEDADKSECI